MTPAARLSAAITVLDRILGGEPVEQALTNWGRASRFAGSGDRAAVRQSTVRHALAGLLTERFSPYLAFCTDDRNPLDIGEHGHLDYMIRTAIQLGAPPLAVWARATSTLYQPLTSPRRPPSASRSRFHISSKERERASGELA